MQILFAGKSLFPITFCNNHKHNCFEVVVVNSGSCILHTDIGNYNFSAGDIYITPPGISHRLVSENGFTDTYIHIDSLDFSPEKITYINTDDDDYIVLLNEILKLYKKKDQGYVASLDLMLSAGIQLVSDTVDENCALQSPNSSPIVSLVRNSINENFFNSEYNYNKIAEHFGYSPDYLRRLFKSAYGMTPSDYLTFVRMRQAKSLLREMKVYSVGEISLLCGFSDRLYFSRCFKKHTGVSPLEYRKQENFA